MSDFQIKYFAERLKKIAKDKFGGVGKLAEKMKVHPSNISNYTKKNAREPRISTLLDFHNAGVDIIYLLTGEDTVGKIEEIEARLSKVESELKETKGENAELKLLLMQLLNENISKDLQIKILAALNIQADLLKMSLGTNST